MKIYLKHVRAAKYCTSGIKNFCKKHGIDFKEFIKSGVDIERVGHIDDAMLKEVIKIAKQEVMNNGN